MQNREALLERAEKKIDPITCHVLLVDTRQNPHTILNYEQTIKHRLSALPKHLQPMVLKYIGGKSNASDYKNQEYVRLVKCEKQITVDDIGEDFSLNNLTPSMIPNIVVYSGSLKRVSENDLKNIDFKQLPNKKMEFASPHHITGKANNDARLKKNREKKAADETKGITSTSTKQPSTVVFVNKHDLNVYRKELLPTDDPKDFEQMTSLERSKKATQLRTRHANENDIKLLMGKDRNNIWHKINPADREKYSDVKEGTPNDLANERMKIKNIRVKKGTGEVITIKDEKELKKRGLLEAGTELISRSRKNIRSSGRGSAAYVERPVVVITKKTTQKIVDLDSTERKDTSKNQKIVPYNTLLSKENHNNRVAKARKKLTIAHTDPNTGLLKQFDFDTADLDSIPDDAQAITRQQLYDKQRYQKKQITKRLGVTSGEESKTKLDAPSTTSDSDIDTESKTLSTPKPEKKSTITQTKSTKSKRKHTNPEAAADDNVDAKQKSNDEQEAEQQPKRRKLEPAVKKDEEKQKSIPSPSPTINTTQQAPLLPSTTPAVTLRKTRILSVRDANPIEDGEALGKLHGKNFARPLTKNSPHFISIKAEHQDTYFNSYEKGYKEAAEKTAEQLGRQDGAVHAEISLSPYLANSRFFIEALTKFSTAAPTHKFYYDLAYQIRVIQLKREILQKAQDDAANRITQESNSYFAGARVDIKDDKQILALLPQTAFIQKICINPGAYQETYLTAYKLKFNELKETLAKASGAHQGKRDAFHYQQMPNELEDATHAFGTYLPIFLTEYKKSFTAGQEELKANIAARKQRDAKSATFTTQEDYRRRLNLSESAVFCIEGRNPAEIAEDFEKMLGFKYEPPHPQELKAAQPCDFVIDYAYADVEDPETGKVKRVPIGRGIFTLHDIEFNRNAMKAGNDDARILFAYRGIDASESPENRPHYQADINSRNYMMAFPTTVKNKEGRTKKIIKKIDGANQTNEGALVNYAVEKESNCAFVHRKNKSTGYETCYIVVKPGIDILPQGTQLGCTYTDDIDITNISTPGKLVGLSPAKKEACLAVSLVLKRGIFSNPNPNHASTTADSHAPQAPAAPKPL